MADNTIVYKYKFTFSDAGRKDFEVVIDADTLELKTARRENYPDWAKLECHRCPCCDLKSGKDLYCPAALALIDVIEFFKDMISCDKVDLEVEARNRTYLGRQVSLQKAVSGLIGLLMASSGCAVLSKLKPMVRHHLPLSDSEETTYRAITMYLMAQHFIYRKSGKPDWDLRSLVQTYKDINIVNENFSQRLRSASSKDANVNAVVILDAFAGLVLFYTRKDSLEDLEKMFGSYFTVGEGR